MHLAVQQYRNFYYDTRLGKITQRLLQNELRRFWPDVREMTVAGYGFAAPLLRPFKREAARTLCLMPAHQGVMAWPYDAPNVAALCAEGRWPLPNGLLDRLILAHALEHAQDLEHLLDEAARCLAPDGRILIVAANRTGMWARRDRTPFGHGRPYSAMQLRKLAEHHGLTPGRAGAALFGPPSHRRFWMRLAPTIERLGRRFISDALAGAIVVEAEKRTLVRSGLRERAAPILAPILSRPQPAPARHNHQRRCAEAARRLGLRR